MQLGEKWCRSLRRLPTGIHLFFGCSGADHFRPISTTASVRIFMRSSFTGVTGKHTHPRQPLTKHLSQRRSSTLHHPPWIRRRPGSSLQGKGDSFPPNMKLGAVEDKKHIGTGPVSADRESLPNEVGLLKIAARFAQRHLFGRSSQNWQSVLSMTALT